MVRLWSQVYLKCLKRRFSGSNVPNSQPGFLPRVMSFKTLSWYQGTVARDIWCTLLLKSGFCVSMRMTIRSMYIWLLPISSELYSNFPSDSTSVSKSLEQNGSHGEVVSTPNYRSLKFKALDGPKTNIYGRISRWFQVFWCLSKLRHSWLGNTRYPHSSHVLISLECEFPTDFPIDTSWAQRACAHAHQSGMSRWEICRL